MKVSIITVALNSSKTLISTIESVNIQSYKNIEHILIDGESSDGTVDIFVQNALRNAVVKSESDEGIYDAMNKGLKLAQGDIVGFLNSDDSFMHENVVTEIVNGINKGFDLVHGNLVYVDQKDVIKRFWNSKGFRPENLRDSMSPAHPTLYCKKTILDSLNGFDTSYKIAGDIDFMIRALLVKNCSIYHINDTLIKMKLGGVSTLSIKSVITITTEVWRSFAENKIYFSRINYLYGKVKKIIKQSLL